MSVQDEARTLTLKEEREKLKQELIGLKEEMHKLSEQMNYWKEQIIQFEARTSPLAQELLMEAEEELKKVEKAYQSKSEEFKMTEERLTETEKTATYIAEQVPKMVPEFLRYFDENKKEFGRRIQNKFTIKSEERIVTNDVYARHSYNIPTSVIEIYNEDNMSLIVSSKDFYFNSKLYELTHDRGNVNVKWTSWYEDYVNDFTSALLASIKENFHDENFKLTIQESGFTLELV